MIGPTPGAVISRRTGAMIFASRLTLRSRSAIWRPIASRARSSGSMAAASSGRSVEQIAGAQRKGVLLCPADDEAEVLQEAADLVLDDRA